MKATIDRCRVAGCPQRLRIRELLEDVAEK